MREDGAELRLVRRACSRLHLDQIRPHGLEAPGLHRYLRPFLIDPELASTAGLLDFVWDTAQVSVSPAEDGIEFPLRIVPVPVEIGEAGASG